MDAALYGEAHLVVRSGLPLATAIFSRSASSHSTFSVAVSTASTYFVSWHQPHVNHGELREPAWCVSMEQSTGKQTNSQPAISQSPSDCLPALVLLAQ